MAAGKAQLTDLPGGMVTRPGADQDGLTRPAQTRPAQTRPAQTRPAQTRPAQTRPAGRAAAVLPLPGAGLAYEVTGDGPAVVLVHGFGLDMRMWVLQTALAAPARVAGLVLLDAVLDGVPWDPAS